MAARGGNRPNSGRKSNAQKLLEANFALSFFSREFQEQSWKSMLSSEDEAIRLKALIYITDRLYRRATEKIEHAGKDGGPLSVSVIDDILAAYGSAAKAR